MTRIARAVREIYGLAAPAKITVSELHGLLPKPYSCVSAVF